MSKQEEAADLRKAAEVRLKAATAGPAAIETNAGDLLRMVHELQVHKLELEMQNNELRQSRVEREAALARYTELYDFAPVGYLTLTFNGLIAEINLTGATLLGVARRDLLLKRFSVFVVNEDRERWAAFLDSVKSNAGRNNVELALQRRDGTVFHALLDCIRHGVMQSGIPWDGADPAAPPAADSSMEVIIALTDISVRKGVEARLQEAMAAAEKANRAKTEFLSSMSHELRTPLNSILGYAQLMESATPPPAASQLRDLERILKAGWYLLELINEILDLSLIESGKAMLTLEPVPMAEVMLECRSMIEPQAQQRGVALSFPECGFRHCIHADRIRVKQVLINLLFNAVKYNRPDGTVVVECDSTLPGAIRISVRDTGAGLAPEQVTQLFQSFNRLGRETGAEEGTGIGLVVSKRLIELMGGRIGVESSVGVGSTFWIELPRASVAPAVAPPAAKAATPLRSQALPPNGGPLRQVLCVEDNPANLELIEQLVGRRTDLRLLTAADGKLGIEFALAYQPQVILMDVSLPDMSGLDAMRILRADPSTAHIPIIALSANAIPKDIATGMEAGFYRYITKPIRINEFMDALELALQFAAAAADSKAAGPAQG